MRRWTLTVVTVLLLGVWLASGRWIVGWFSSPSAGGRQIGVTFISGGVGFQYCSPPSSASGFHVFERRTGPMLPAYHLSWVPFWNRYGPLGVTTFFLPLWVPVLLAAGGSAMAWRRHRFAGRLERGECPACGYDLSGLPTGDETTRPTCPECGA